MEKAKELQNEILNLKNIVITSGPALGRNYTILEILKNNSLDFEVIEINEKTSLESILPKNDKITVLDCYNLESTKNLSKLVSKHKNNQLVISITNPDENSIRFVSLMP